MALNLPATDKSFWHGYIPFYEKFFDNRHFERIAEFGIFKGDSIRWLLQRFPQAQIYGADILDWQPTWPKDNRFHFTQLDQNQRDQICSFLDQDSFDLIIEDGSHIPRHQVNCLVEGFQRLKAGGIYILEDIHTSLPNHPLYTPKKSGIFAKTPPFVGNALTVLLGIAHYIKIGAVIDDKKISAIASGSLMAPDEVRQLSQQIESIHLYRRTDLPDHCHKCGATDFDFSHLKCFCGEEIYSDKDSMSFVILKK